MAPDLWSQLSGAMDAAEEMESSPANRFYSAGVDKFSSSHFIAGKTQKVKLSFLLSGNSLRTLAAAKYAAHCKPKK